MSETFPHVRYMASFSATKMYSQDIRSKSGWKCGTQVCHTLYFISRVAQQTFADVAYTNHRYDKES